jgi:hypothetical protein
MANILFDRQSLKVVGSNRSPLPFEVEVKNVEASELTKTITYNELKDMKDDSGRQLFVLPREPLVDEVGKHVQIETIENTGSPVLVEVLKQVPILDQNNHQVEYELTQIVVTPAVIDEETGEVIEEEKVEQVGTGQFIKCFTIEVEEEQKRDESGLKLFYKDEVVMETVVTPQEDLAVTEDDERYVEGLAKLYGLVEKTRIVSFISEPEQFDYSDICKAKELQITHDTFFAAATLFEEMDESIFSTGLAGFNADLGFDFVSIPAGGEVRTIKLALPTGSNVVGIKTETSDDGLVISIGDTASNLTQVVNNEVSFQSKVSEVYVKFENPTDKRIDVQSFALLV